MINKYHIKRRVIVDPDSRSFEQIVVQIDTLVATLPLVDRSRSVSLALNQTGCAAYIAKCPQISEWLGSLDKMKPPSLREYVSEADLAVDGAKNVLEAIKLVKSRRSRAETLFEQAVERSPFLDRFLIWSAVIVPLVKDLDSPDKVLEIDSFRVCLMNFAAANSAQEISQATDVLARLLTHDQLAELQGKINACGGFKEITGQIDAHARSLSPQYRAKHIPPAITQAGAMGYVKNHPQLHAWILNLSSKNIEPLYGQWPATDQSIDRALGLLDVFVTVQSRKEVDQIWYLLNRRINVNAVGSAIEFLNQALEELDISKHVRNAKGLAVWLDEIVKEVRSPRLYDIIDIITLQQLTAIRKCVDRLRKRLVRAPAVEPLREDDYVSGCRFGGGLDPALRVLLRDEIENLDPTSRRVLKRRFWDGLKLQEIADEEGRSISWVSKTIADALGQLRDRLEGDGC